MSPTAFTFFTAADAERVWQALTDPADTGQYLYGLRLSSQWTPDAPIDVRYRDGTCLGGRVLCLWPGERLSYLLEAPDAPPTYLTWLLRTTAAGTVCSLQIDEIDDVAVSTDQADLEDTWLPVLAALQQLLTRT